MLSLKRDFTRFLENQSFPQKVEVHIDEEQLVCSGIILAQQSALIEQLITENDGVLVLDKVNGIGTTEQKLNCIRYMYGAGLDISMENICPTIKFASLYGVGDLFHRCTQWIEKNITSRNMCIFHEIPLFLESSKHQAQIYSLIQKFISKNNDDAGKEIAEQLAHGNTIDPEMFLSVVSNLPSNGAELLQNWISKSAAHKLTILDSAEDLDFVELFPNQEDFTAFVAELSAGSDSVDLMKQVLAIQQGYFVKSCAEEQPVLQNQSKQHVNKIQSTVVSESSKADDNAGITKQRTRKPRGGNRNAGSFKPGIQPSKVSQGSQPSKTINADQRKTLFVANLPQKATMQDIMAPLNFAGKILNVDVKSDKNIAFIRFSDERAVKVILDASKNGVQFTVLGKVVAVKHYSPGGKPNNSSLV